MGTEVQSTDLDQIYKLSGLDYVVEKVPFTPEEKEEFLKVKLEKPEDKILLYIEKDIIKGETQFKEMLKDYEGYDIVLDSYLIGLESEEIDVIENILIQNGIKEIIANRNNLNANFLTFLVFVQLTAN